MYLTLPIDRHRSSGAEWRPVQRRLGRGSGLGLRRSCTAAALPQTPSHSDQTDTPPEMNGLCDREDHAFEKSISSDARAQKRSSHFDHCSWEEEPVVDVHRIERVEQRRGRLRRVHDQNVVHRPATVVGLKQITVKLLLLPLETHGVLSREQRQVHDVKRRLRQVRRAAREHKTRTSEADTPRLAMQG